MKNLQILCVDGVFDSAAHLLRDVLQAAAKTCQKQNSLNPISIQTCTIDGQAIRTGSGQTLVPDRKADAEADLVILPGISCENVSEIHSYLKQDSVVEVGNYLQHQHRARVELATACTGAWLVAEAGLLDGKKATTTWHLGTDFQNRYPNVNLQLGRMVTRDQGIWCAGAAMAHMDLALAIVTATCGAEISREVASRLLLDNRPSQSHYMVTDFLGEQSSDFHELDLWVREHIEDAFSVADMASAVGLSERSLARRVKKATGETPSQYVQRLRVNHAIFLLETTSLSFAEITRRSGYREPASLRRLIRKQTGRAPSSFRTSGDNHRG